MESIKKVRTNTVAFLLVGATVLFIIFNFSTTRETLVWIFGGSVAITCFSIAIAALDIAGIARMFIHTGRDSEEEDEVNLKVILMVVWLIAAVGDVFLTWLWAAIAIEMNGENMVLSEALRSNSKLIAPIMVAIGEAAVRIPLVIALSKYGERWFYNRDASPQHSFSPPKTAKPRPAQGARQAAFRNIQR